jgi:exonuclease SbcC
VEQVLGLDFDSFTKVVLLPQNEFDAFLRGKPEERRSILTRLLSLEIYGAIQQRANLVATDANAQAEVLTGLLERDYADATAERLAEVKKARAAAEVAVETLTGRRTSIERAVGVAFETRQRRLAYGQANENLADLQRTLVVARDEHDGATGALAVADRDLTTIAERLASISYDADRHLLLARAAERATRLGQVIVALARVDRDDAAGRARLDELVRRRDTLLNGVRDADEALAQTLVAETQALADLDALQQRFGTRAAIAGLMERERQCREDRRQEREVDRALETLNARQAELTGSLVELRSRHAEASERLEDAERVREERDRAFEACRAIQTQAQPVGQSLAQARARVSRAQVALDLARADANRKRAVLVEGEQTRQAAQDIVDAAEKALAQLQHAHAAHTLRGTIAIGQPCPVCARKVTKVPGGEPLEDVEHVRRSAVNGRARLTKVQAQEQRAALEVAAADETLRATTSTWEETPERSRAWRRGAPPRAADGAPRRCGVAADASRAYGRGGGRARRGRARCRCGARTCRRRRRPDRRERG